MDPKSCCTRKTCPRNLLRLTDEGSSQRSSEPEYSDKQTQKNKDFSFEDLNAQSAATSETHFNRNNENISTPQQPSSPTNAPHFKQTYSHLHPRLETGSSFKPICQNDPFIGVPQFWECSHMATPISTEERSSSQSQEQRCSAGSQSACETTTSSSSTTSENVPLRLILNSKHIASIPALPHPNRTEHFVFPSLMPRPKRLQPRDTEKQQWIPQNYFSVTEDCEYYSCSSPSSEDDKPNFSTTYKSHSRNEAILKLLHQMLHLLTEECTTKKDIIPDSKSTPQPKTVGTAKQPNERASNLKISNPNANSEEVKGSPNTGGACSQLRLLLDKHKNNKLKDLSQTTSTDEYRRYANHKPNFQFAADNKTSTLSSSVNDTLDDQPSSRCSKGESTPKIKTNPPYSHYPIPPAPPPSPLPPCPCFCFYTAAWAAAQGLAIPMSSALDQWLMLFPPFHVGGPAQHLKQEDYWDCESKEYDQKPKSKPDLETEPELHRVNQPSPKEDEYIDEEIHPRILGIEPLDHCQNYEPYPDCIMTYDDEEPDRMSPTGDNTKFPTEMMEIKPRVEIKEIEYIDEELYPRILGIETPEHCLNYEPFPDCIMSYDDEEPDPIKDKEVLPFQINDKNQNTALSTMEYVDEELHPRILGIESVLSQCQNYVPYPECINPYDDEEPQQEKSLAFSAFRQGVTARVDGDDRDDCLDDVSRTSDDELEKEKRGERNKNRSHKDPCHCEGKRHIGENQCTTLATSQQSSAGVEEFKYFVDSLVIDLEAMEHARRKCNVVKNVCMSQPGVCSRESFPVTIVDVQDLGATSLYVKWTIHDCCGIGGYEIFVDGYLTNRYYHSRHEAAVITNVDITMPHKVALVAQPANMCDNGLEDSLGSCPNATVKCKYLTWKTEGTNDRRSYQTVDANLWTPSIYLYVPAQNQAATALSILNGNI